MAKKEKPDASELAYIAFAKVRISEDVKKVTIKQFAERWLIEGGEGKGGREFERLTRYGITPVGKRGLGGIDSRPRACTIAQATEILADVGLDPSVDSTYEIFCSNEDCEKEWDGEERWAFKKKLCWGCVVAKTRGKATPAKATPAKKVTARKPPAKRRSPDLSTPNVVDEANAKLAAREKRVTEAEARLLDDDFSLQDREVDYEQKKIPVIATTVLHDPELYDQAIDVMAQLKARERELDLKELQLKARERAVRLEQDNLAIYRDRLEQIEWQAQKRMREAEEKLLLARALGGGSSNGGAGRFPDEAPTPPAPAKKKRASRRVPAPAPGDNVHDGSGVGGFPPAAGGVIDDLVDRHENGVPVGAGPDDFGGSDFGN